MWGRLDSATDKACSLHAITEAADKIITIGDSSGEFGRLFNIGIDARRQTNTNGQNETTFTYEGRIYILADILIAN